MLSGYNSLPGKIILFLFIPVFFHTVRTSAQPFSLSAVSDLVRVFDDGYNLPAGTDTLKMFGIRGETLSGQFVVSAGKDLSDVSVTIGRIINMHDNSSLAADKAVWNFVGSVPLSENASNQPLTTVTRKAPANFPDYLTDKEKTYIRKGVCQAIWLTIEVPSDLEAGSYYGNVLVSCDKGERTLPLSLAVYPLSMPEKRHLKVTEWYSTDGFEKFYGITEKYSPEWFAMLHKFAENMAAHRQNVFQVPMSSISITDDGTGNLEFDFSKFGRMADVFWETGKMDYLETGELAHFGKGGFSSTDISFKDFPVRNIKTGETAMMNGDMVVKYLLPEFERYLRRKGWLDKTIFHIKDEPSHHNALKWIDISRTVHDYAPDLKRIDAVCTSFLFGNIEIAVPKLDHLDAGYDKYKAEQQKGNELWFYTVGIYQGSNYPNKTIDMPLIDSRILHWLNYAYDLKGYLHWGWNQWTDDPYHDPDIHIGDGWHVYPSRTGVLNSLRWEEMRNGIQDYEYFLLLENRIKVLKDSLGSGFSWINPRQRGMEIVKQAAGSLKDHTRDPGVLYSAKMSLIKELLDFDVSPRVYIQTSPPEHGTIINRSVVELLGWAEPGTTITVNGKNLPVDRNGQFMERYLIYVGDKLEVRAKNQDKEKILIRNYNMKY